jgi:hypothetical protein
MSLVATSSPWTNDDITSKKRIPSIRKTIKLKPQSELNSYNNSNGSNNSIDNLKEEYDQRTSRVNNLLNQITASDTQDDNNKLGEFKPISPPEISVKGDYNDNTDMKQYIPPLPKFSGGGASSNILGDVKNYGANDTHSQKLSNYSQSYNPPSSNGATTPYYANMGLSGSKGDDKLMEKINYMIHILEEQQTEKTDNITEEFLLYTFLGIFVIFVVDSFAKAGKYTR